MLNLDQIYFISNICTADYANKYFNIQKISPFSASAMACEDFLLLMQNIELIDYSAIEIVPYENVKVIKLGYKWEKYNKNHDIDTRKTFAINFNLPRLGDKIQVFYRHYELNLENMQKIYRRINRVRNSEKQPFFIFQFTKEMNNIIDLEKKLKIIKCFKAINYKYKLFIDDCDISSKYIHKNSFYLKSSKRHFELMPLLEKHLNKYWNMI